MMGVYGVFLRTYSPESRLPSGHMQVTSRMYVLSRLAWVSNTNSYARRKSRQYLLFWAGPVRSNVRPEGQPRPFRLGGAGNVLVELETPDPRRLHRGPKRIQQSHENAQLGTLARVGATGQLGQWKDADLDGCKRRSPGRWSRLGHILHGRGDILLHSTGLLKSRRPLRHRRLTAPRQQEKTE